MSKMVLEKQDSGISLSTTTTADSDKNDLGILKDLEDAFQDLKVFRDLDDVFADDFYYDDEPVAAHKKVCCALCR